MTLVKSFRSKNLKDAIYEETKIDCNFCEIHTPRDREGTGEFLVGYSLYPIGYKLLLEQSLTRISVSFDTKEDMEDVLKAMDGFELKGRKIELKRVSFGFLTSELSILSY